MTSPLVAAALVYDAPSGGKFIPEHGPPALRRLSGCLVLDDVPMLGEQSVFDTQDVDHDPVHWLPDP